MAELIPRYSSAVSVPAGTENSKSAPSQPLPHPPASTLLFEKKRQIFQKKSEIFTSLPDVEHKAVSLPTAGHGNPTKTTIFASIILTSSPDLSLATHHTHP